MSRCIGLRVLLLCLPLCLSLGGCVERGSPTVRGLEPVGPIYAGRGAAQTFVPRSDLPLVGIDVQLATYARRNTGTVTLSVRREPDRKQDPAGQILRTASVEAADLQDSAVHRFRFDPLVPASLDAPPLRFVIESTAASAESAVSVWSTFDDVEPTGNAFYHGRREPSDLVFAPVYGESFWGAAVAQLRQLAGTGMRPWASILLLFIPGLALAGLLLDRRTYGLDVQIAAAPAFGLAAAAIGLLWADVFQVRIGGALVWAALLVAGVVGGIVGSLSLWERVGVRARPWLAGRRASGVAAVEARAGDEPPPYGRAAAGADVVAAGANMVTALATSERHGRAAGAPGLDRWFLVAFGAAGFGLLVRGIVLDGAPVPPGADAFHHVLITQLMLERGGVPTSYEPYAPISSFSYHFGFHAFAALVGWASGATALEAVSTVAPLLNALVALSVYGLARMAGLTGQASAIAAVCAALVSPFPMGLLGIARYPQSAALVILPVVLGLVLVHCQEWFCVSKGDTPSPQPSPRGRGSNGSRPSLWERPASRESGRSRVRAGVRASASGALALAVLAAGLCLTHYRVALMFVAFLGVVAIAWVVAGVFRRWRARARSDRGRAPDVVTTGDEPPRYGRKAAGADVVTTGDEPPRYGRAAAGGDAVATGDEPPRSGRAAAGADAVTASATSERDGWATAFGLVGAALLVAPWGARLIQSFTMGLPGSGPPRAAEYFSLDRLGTGLDPRLVAALGAAALFGLIAAIAGRRVGIILLGAWAAALLLFANPRWLPVPGAGALDVVTVATSLFVPGALAVGLAVAGSYRWLQRRGRVLAAAALGVLGLGASLWGAAQLTALTDASDRLVDPADLAAATWMRTVLPETSVLAVNAAIRQWDPDFVVPTDGGQWLPLLAGRRTTLLPLLYPAERGTPLPEVQRMEQIARSLASDAAGPQTVALLRAAGATHVYVGARGGPIDEGKLATSAAHRKVYGKGGVSIYELLDGTGTADERRP